MEYLRWILLAGGILFVILVYVLGRRRGNSKAVDEEFDNEEMPSFSARDWDELDEGVGEVRIIARHNDDDSPFAEADDSADEVLAPQRDQPPGASAADEAVTRDTPSDGGEADTAPPAQSRQGAEPEVIVLYIIAGTNTKLAGDRINSALRANGMVFGDMNIFHRMDERGKSVYSIANMIEPGYFDPVSIHELRTPGVILFMQLPGPLDPLTCFNDMLRTAYVIAEMLDAQLCNSKRQPLSEADTESLRSRLATFGDSKPMLDGVS